MAKDLGLHALDRPEEPAGAGLTAVDLAIVLDELGSVLYRGPYLATVGWAAGMLAEAARAGNPAAEELLMHAADGVPLALAGADCGAAWPATGVLATAVPAADRWLVTGIKEAVLQADAARVLLTLAKTPSGESALFATPATNVEVVVMNSIDPTRALGKVVLDGAESRLLAEDASRFLRPAAYRALVALAAESLGGARRCLEMATAHAGQRTQFGRPIGSFQAVKHRLADGLVRLELAVTAVYVAACHVAAGDQESSAVSAPAAAYFSAETFLRLAQDNIQVHGGIGFTWEHDAHLYLKRAVANRQLLGAPLVHLAAIYDAARAQIQPGAP